MNAVLAEVVVGIESSCVRCGTAERVWSATLRKFIPCPICSGAYGLPFDPDALRRMARKERKRLRTQVAIVVLETIATETRALSKLKVPPELITTDRVLDRWTAFGTGAPAENPDVYHQSLPPPLDPETQVRVSEIVRTAPALEREVTYDLYSRGAPMSWVGQKHGMNPRSIGRFWHDVLRLHRESFLVSGYPDLVNLVIARP